MDSKESFSDNFIPEYLLQIPSVVVNSERRQRRKLVSYSDRYTLIVKFPAKNDKAKGQGSLQSPWKKELLEWYLVNIWTKNQVHSMSR